MLGLYRVCTCKAARLDAVVEAVVRQAGHVLRGADLAALLVVAVIALDTLAGSLRTTADTEEEEEGEVMHGDGESDAGGTIKQLDTALCCYNTTPLLLHSTE